MGRISGEAHVGQIFLSFERLPYLVSKESEIPTMLYNYTVEIHVFCMTDISQLFNQQKRN